MKLDYFPYETNNRCCCPSLAAIRLQAFAADGYDGRSTIEVTSITSPVIGAFITKIKEPGTGTVYWEGKSEYLNRNNFPEISRLYAIDGGRKDIEIQADVMPVIGLRAYNSYSGSYCHSTSATILSFGSIPWVSGCFQWSVPSQCNSFSPYYLNAGHHMEIADSAKPQKNTFALLGDRSLNYRVFNPENPGRTAWDLYKFKLCTKIGSSITNLMSSAVNTSDFSYAFDCTGGGGGGQRSAKIVPDMFVGCVNAEDFSFCFQGGSGSTKRNPSVYIPNNIFRGCEKARKFGSCFALSDCYAFHDNGRGAIPGDLFEGTAADDFSHCFSRNPVQPPLPLMSAPPLWERFPNANGTGCFYGWGDSRYNDGTFTKLDATWNCPNWFDIPYEWSFQ